MFLHRGRGLRSGIISRLDYVLTGMSDRDSEASWRSASSYGASSWGGRSEAEPSVLRRVPPPSRGLPEALLGLDGTGPR